VQNSRGIADREVSLPKFQLKFPWEIQDKDVIIMWMQLERLQESSPNLILKSKMLWDKVNHLSKSPYLAMSISAEADEIFEKWKVGKIPARYLVFRLDDTMKTQVDHIGPPDCSWQEFIGQLKEDQPCYIAYHLEYTTTVGKRSKSVLIQWISGIWYCVITYGQDSLDVKKKMFYSMFSGPLKTPGRGFHCVIQAADKSDISWDAVLEKVMRVEKLQITNDYKEWAF
jgi:hypothetical protein